jgi:hypothetical protein
MSKDFDQTQTAPRGSDLGFHDDTSLSPAYATGDPPAALRRRNAGMSRMSASAGARAEQDPRLPTLPKAATHRSGSLRAVLAAFVRQRE